MNDVFILLVGNLCDGVHRRWLVTSLLGSLSSFGLNAECGIGFSGKIPDLSTHTNEFLTCSA